jgi:hypothetical protein
MLISEVVVAHAQPRRRVIRRNLLHLIYTRPTTQRSKLYALNTMLIAEGDQGAVDRDLRRSRGWLLKEQ